MVNRNMELLSNYLLKLSYGEDFTNNITIKKIRTAGLYAYGSKIYSLGNI